MREHITIDVTRTTGSRSARVRVFVAPRPGEPGVAYTVGSVRLGPDVGLGQAAAEHMSHLILDLLTRASSEGWGAPASGCGEDQARALFEL